MKITGIQNIPIEVPYCERLGPHMQRVRQTPKYPTIRTHIYIVETDAGLTGYGEGPNLGDGIEAYIGHHPVEYLMDDRAGGFQIACYDLVGKFLGEPAHRLYGPQVRSEVLMCYWTHCFVPEMMASEARLAFENGFRVHKLKARPWESTVEQVAAMVEGMPSDYRIVVDPNGSYGRPTEALRIIRDLEAFPHVWALEEPISWDQVDGYKFLKSHIDFPIALHADIPSVLTAVREGLCDYFVSEFHYSAKLVQDCGVARAGENREFWVENGLWTGISHAFQLHQAAAIANIYLLITLSVLAEDDMIVEPMIVKDGHMAVPEGPGLGVTLDMDALEKYRID